MARTQKAKQSILALGQLRTWQLLVLLVLLGFIAATFLRLNNVGMVQRRGAVLTADKAGDKEATTARLYDLQRYVAARMNASTGPFYLEHQYRRDVDAAIEAAKSYKNPNGNIYAKSEAVCRPQFAAWSQAYVQCFAEELSKYPPSPDPAERLSLPRPELYRYAFNSPLWSLDFAGMTLLPFLLVALIVLMRLLSRLALSLFLRHRYGSLSG